MTPVLSILGILGGLFVGVISPGPSFILVTRTAIARSRHEGLAAALGMGVGAVLFTLLALTGWRALLVAVPWLYVALKIVGGLYLLWLALGLWRGGHDALGVSGEDHLAAAPRGRTFLLALVTQVSNPKTALFYGSVFAALLPKSFAAWWFFVLPPLVFVLEAGWYSVVALVFSSPRPRAAYLRFKAAVDRFAGTFLGLLGLRLLFDRHSLNP